MEEKQEFQLGDTFYYVWRDDYGYWHFSKEIVTGIILTKDGISLKNGGSYLLQRLCGHTLEEAKDIAIKDWYQKHKSNIKQLRDLRE